MQITRTAEDLAPAATVYYSFYGLINTNKETSGKLNHKGLVTAIQYANYCCVHESLRPASMI